MASPFDFSAFLLTPPLPKSMPASGDNTGNNGNSSGNGQHGSDNLEGGSMSLNVPGQYGNDPYSAAPSNSNYQFNNSQQPGTGYQNESLSLASATSVENSGGDGNSYQQQQQQQQQQANQQHQTAGTSNLPVFDERDYGLDPSAFSSVSFALPSFLSGASNPGQFGDGPSVVDPSAFHPPAMSSSYPSSAFSLPSQAPLQPAQQQQILSSQLNNSTQSANAQSKQRYVPDPHNPVYGIYGSSVISVNPDLSPFKLAPNSVQQAVLASNPPRPPEDRGTTPDFDPKSLGLPVGSQLFPQPLPGLYSSSGFDMLGVLARVVARPNPQINIGPVDTSCSFIVIDARRYDMPIVFASETFAKLTGYSNSEIIGRNCRFLQAPDGHVTAGSRRKYTDGNAVYHLKTHISSGKECQASIINYRKDGSPFINLVTVIPISWDTDEIAYFVGFQVDLVEQPNAILEKMRNGTYVVNYSLLPTNAPAPAPVPTVPAAAYKQEEQDTLQKKEPERWMDQKPVKVINPTASANALAAAAQSSMTIAPELLEVMGQADNASELDDDAAKKKWNKMLLDHTGDFVHVLSLKGSFLYVSPSVKSMLEYEPSDLIGKTLQSVCHPSDIVPVMRELKDSSTITHPNINLLYRFRRKSSGYIWLEAEGKLYIEQSKSRKCVILVGRERPVYKLSWQDLRLAGGLGEKEFWSKISLDGKFLYNTPTVKAVIGHDADALRGTSIFELIESSKAPELLRALQDAAAGKSVRLHHKLRNEKRVLVDCITNFYPNSQAKSPTQNTGKGLVHPSIIAQTNEYSSEMRRRATLPAAKVSSLPGPTGVAGTPRGSRPTYLRAESGVVRDMIVTTPEPAAGDGGSEDSGSSKEEDREKRSSSGPQSGSDSSAPSTFSAIPSTYKTLLHHPSSQNDNVFDELDTTRTTSWQYELHQLKLTNKKLKEELHMLQAAKRKRKKKEELQSRMEASASPAPQPNPANPDQKICANCGRTDSPEWRVGPSGARNLCNACGLRWAKATRGQNRQASVTPVGCTTPSSVSDMDTSAPGSFMGQQASSGPFAPRTVNK